MRTILCFGDSNTYGYRPDNKKRYPGNVRWTGILNSLLDDTSVIEEGLVGRTTVFEDNFREGRKGIDYIIPILESHEPVDELVLMLGTNDCKTIYNASPSTIGLGIERIIKKVKEYDNSKKILLVSPIHLGEDVWKENYDPEFDRDSILVSKKLKGIYKKIAQEYDCRFIAASDVAEPSVQDMEHLNEEGHEALAKAIYEIVK